MIILIIKLILFKKVMIGKNFMLIFVIYNLILLNFVKKGYIIIVIKYIDLYIFY